MHSRGALPSWPGLGFGPPSLCCQGEVAGVTCPGLSLDGGVKLVVYWEDVHNQGLVDRYEGLRDELNAFGVSTLAAHKATSVDPDADVIVLQQTHADLFPDNLLLICGDVSLKHKGINSIGQTEFTQGMKAFFVASSFPF